MLSELDLAIQQHLMRYLSGDTSLADFENWFVPLLWEIDEEPEATRERAGNIHILLSELSNGDLTIADFNKRLTEFICVSGENRSDDAISRAESAESYATSELIGASF